MTTSRRWFWKLIWRIVSACLIAGIMAVGITGILGYLDTTEDDCYVDACNDTVLFYQGKNTSFAHVFIRSAKNGPPLAGKGLIQRNGDYYNISDCKLIPETIKCYYYEKTCVYYRGGESCYPISEQLLPIRQLFPCWAFFFTILLLPGLILWYTETHVGDPTCTSCAPAKEFCIIWSRIPRSVAWGLSMFCLIVSVSIMTLGLTGILGNELVICQNINCSLKETVSKGQMVNGTSITIESVQYNSLWHIEKPQFTYLDSSKNDCAEVDDIIPCLYSPADHSINTSWIPNNYFLIMLVPIILCILCITISALYIKQKSPLDTRFVAT